MANNENYQRNPDKDLEEVLKDCGWKRIGFRLWQEGRSRIYVDVVGLFLYRLLAGTWVRTYGLTHNRISIANVKERMIFFRDGASLDLRTGE